MNEELSSHQFGLVKAMHQGVGVPFYGLVNKVADEQSKLGTARTPSETALFKAIVSHPSTLLATPMMNIHSQTPRTPTKAAFLLPYVSLLVQPFVHDASQDITLHPINVQDAYNATKQ